ncbi:MAG: hypothetical protein Q9187_002019 [Circinaria calcarea]
MPYIIEAAAGDTLLEPIAIVGMGSVDSASSLWDVLKEKKSVQTKKVPANRFNIDAHYHPDLSRPGSFHAEGGYFLEGDLADFDPTFFGMTPIEAMWLDPQQRKMLEVSYECLESAGLSLEVVAGSNTAVFVGSFTSDYQQMSTREPDFRHNYTATGVDVGIISNRIGNTFNLNGPSFTINTACSSSIYAIHNACHALRTGDCEAAIAGGVNLILTVDQHMNTAKLSILSPTSTCHTFDSSADGYGRAEGAGALYLKRLSDAVRDGNVIRGIIRSSAVNTNGKVEGMGLTHPSVKGQETVVRKAYERGGLDPNKTAYLECHGTGTPVGDPIEVRAVSNAMNDTRSPDAPLLIGAIKANIGHSEAASGIFAVMKAAMVTESAIIPGVCGLQNINPAIKESEWNVKINVDTRPWPKEFEVRRASVSSFGYGGTNGHIIVESADGLCPWYEHGKPKAIAKYQYNTARPFLIGPSAHDKKTLVRNIEAYQKIVKDFYLPDIAYTLNSRRTRFSNRAFIITAEQQEASAFDTGSFTFGVASSRPVKLGFIFTGQGAQWPGMGVEAMRTFPAFGRTIDALDAVLQSVSPAPTWTLREALESPKESSRVSEAEISQPVCTAVQIAIVDLFASWNIKPAVTVGHSSGEIGAAYAAGRLSAPEAILAGFFRGLAVKKAAPVGTMLAVGIGASAIQQYIPELVAEEVTIACENSSSSVTLSGLSPGIIIVKERLDKAKIFARELPTGKAYHSSQMNAVATLYSTLYTRAFNTLDDIDFEWRQPKAPMVSSVTGKLYTRDDISIQYWCDNLRSRVLFDSAMTTLGQSELFSDVSYLVEIGPHSALAGPIKQICSANEFSHLAYTPTLTRGCDSSVALLKTAGELYIKGLSVDFQQINRIEDSADPLSGRKQNLPRYLVDLPPYQWNYEKNFWYEPRFSHEQRRSKFARHDILGRKIFGLSDNSLTWKNTLRHKDVPWLKDHRLGDAAVFPGAGHFSLAVEAYMQALDVDEDSIAGVTLRDVNIKAALIIPETDDGIEIQTRMQRVSQFGSDSVWYDFTVESIDNGVWTTHSKGRIGMNLVERPFKQDFDCPIKLNKLHQHTLAKRWYDSFNLVGFEYGPSFQTLSHIRTNGKDRAAAADVYVTNDCRLMNKESRYMLHPSTIDGCLQLLNVSVHSGLHKDMPFGVVPLEMEEISLFFPGSDCAIDGSAVAWTDNTNGRYFNTNIQLLGTSGKLILDIKNLRSVSYEAAVPQRRSDMPTRQPYSQISWKPDITALSDVQAKSVFPSNVQKDQCIARMIELLNHQKPVQNTLILGNASIHMLLAVRSSMLTTSILTVGLTSAKEAEKLVSEVEGLNISMFVLPDDNLELAEAVIESHDLFILDESLISRASTSDLVNKLNSNAVKGSHMIAYLQLSDMKTAISNSIGFTPPQLSIDCGSVNIMLASAEPHQNRVVHLQRRIAILSHWSPDAVSKKLAEKFQENDCGILLSKIDEANIANVNEIIINDCHGTFLSAPTKKSFNALKVVLCSGKSIVWLTKGVNQGNTISGGMSQGFLRAVRSEQAAARIALVDIDEDVTIEDVTPILLDKLEHNSVKDSGLDTEFWIRGCGIVHVPRLISQDALNLPLSDDIVSAISVPIDENVEYESSINGNDLVFEPKRSSSGDKDLDVLEAEIQVIYSELSAEDLSTGSQRPRIVLGKVLDIGSGLEQSLVGQEVVTYINRCFETRIKSSAFVRISTAADALPEAPQFIATLPNLCKAIDAIVKTGKARSGDHVLLLPSALPFVDAVARLSRVLSFQFSAVVMDAEEKDECIARYHLDSASLLLAKDVEAIRELMTSAAAPNVVIAHSFSALSQETWRFMASMGRFVLCDAAIDVPLDTLPFTKGVSFLTTGISTRFTRDKSSLNDLLQSAVELICGNSDTLTRNPLVMDIGRLSDLQNARSDGALLEPNVLKVSYGESIIKTRETQENLKFSSTAAYLLVGCLGGLGRSLTTWMLEHGCRNFVFLSRSGADKPEAAEVVGSLRKAGASVQIFRADAGDKKAVANVLSIVSSTISIRGVVHAAMVLQDGMYEGMSFEKYISAVYPKMLGAISLHEALNNTPLDFFVMTSSISAVLGNPGQANYCAGNSYLEALAWYRRKHGLAASAIALPMVLDVGVVAENQDIELSLNRKGMYGIDEREMLAAFEAGMRQGPPKDGQAHIGEAQIALGLDPASLAAAVSSQDTANVYWYNDARLNNIRAAVEALSTSGLDTSGSAAAGFVGSLTGKSPQVVIESIGEYIIKRCSSILMLPAENFEMENKSVGSYGLDSMIGAELRTWLFKEFGLEIGFQVLLGQTLTFTALAKMVAEVLGLLG